MPSRLFSILLLLLLSAGLSAPAGADNPAADKVKAAYLFNFAKFIHWPEGTFAQATSPLTIGVLGDSRFAAQLNKLQGKRIQEHPILIEYYPDLASIGQCQILYLAPPDPGQITPFLHRLAGQAIVTVAEEKNFSQQGGMIQFIPVRGRLRFIINLNSAKQSRIRIDSRLLSLAIEVMEAKP
ncbi:YfiR family protein [Desulfogranum mediterraneum]|uniref:YfiR family protein n=1 Tax=Desulfogranum mediterraneum TaxID=160661 RepID=UPI0004236315|nr:YfiR family protein [Desulfogranum mediterraneum]